MDFELLTLLQHDSDEAREFLNKLTELQLNVKPHLDGEQIKFFLNRTPHLKKLFLETTKFTKWPNDIPILEHLEEFSFDMSKLPGNDFNKLFAIMPNVKKIAFSLFTLSQLPDNLPMLDHVQHLDLSVMKASGQNLKKLLAIMPNLKQLNLRCYNFSPLPDGLARLEHVKRLELIDPITEADFKKLMDIMPNLKEIFGLNIISPIPEVNRYDNIEEISLRGMLTGDDFKKLMALMPKLKRIKRSFDCFLLSIPEDLPKLEYLEYIDIQSSTLTGEDLKGLTAVAPNLKELLISCGNFGLIPDNFPVLLHLEKLNLSESIITGDNFKTLMAKLPKITQLILDESLSLSQIPDDISNLAHVEELQISVTSLDDNNFKKLIGMMPNLKIISFDNPQVPAGLPRLEHVEVIYLEGELTAVDFRRIISMTNPVNITEINLRWSELRNMDLKIGEFNFPRLTKLDLTTNIELNELLVLIAATSESKQVHIDIYPEHLLYILEGASWWATAILVGAFPQHLLNEFTTNPEYKQIYQSILISKTFGTDEAQSLFIANHHPNEQDFDYELFEHNRVDFEALAAKYWKKFTGTLAMTPYKVVMEVLNEKGALLELLNSKRFVLGDMEKIAAYDIFAELYLHRILKTIKKVGTDYAIEYTRKDKHNLYLHAKAINALLRQEECYEKLEKCRDIIEFFQTLFKELFDRAYPKPPMPRTTQAPTSPRKKHKYGS